MGSSVSWEILSTTLNGFLRDLDVVPPDMDHSSGRTAPSSRELTLLMVSMFAGDRAKERARGLRTAEY